MGHSIKAEIRFKTVPIVVAAITLTACIGSAPLRADQKAESILKETKIAFKNAKTLSASYRSSVKQNGQTANSSGTLQLKKPGMGVLRFAGPDKIIIAANGKTVYQTLPGNQYVKMSEAQGGLQSFAARGLPIALFFGVMKSSLVDLSLPTLHPTYVGAKTIDGVKCDVVQIVGKTPFSYALKLFIRSDNHLMSRMEINAESKGKKLFQSQDFLNYKLNAPIANGSFAISLPKGAKLYAPPTQSEDPSDSLIPVGKTAPAFSLPNPAGGNVSLSESLRGKKAVLVNFWFYG